MSNQRYCPQCGWPGEMDDCRMEREYDHDPVSGKATCLVTPVCPFCGHQVEVSEAGVIKEVT